MDFGTSLTVVLLSAIGSAAGAYAAGYFSSRGRRAGEIAAVAQNLEEVVRQLQATTRVSERIRASLSREVWVDQEKWKLKRDAYLTLLDDLHTFGSALIEAKGGGGSDDEQGGRLAQILKRQHEARAAFTAEVTRAHFVAQLIMPPASWAVLDELAKEIAPIIVGARVNGSAFRDLWAANRRASTLLIEAAKRDLALDLEEA